jgi:CheY-like chemotaxis protein
VNGGTEGSSTIQRVSKLTPASRQAFLLQSLEGFSLEDTASVMNVTTGQASEMIKNAEADIEKELCTNVLIIEDEPIIAADIEGLVLELGHTVDSISATRSDAVRNANAKSPGLVLADVHLADGSSGIDAVEDILSDYDVPVIFITAFPERLLTGDKPEPAYLISKPFEPDNVKAAISQALFFH